MTAYLPKLTKISRPALALAVMAAVAGCGGGSGGSSSDGSVVTPPPGGGVVTPPPGGGGDPGIGIDRGGVFYAELTGFGSIVVAGVRYDTAGAAITVEGQPATQSALEVGDVVLVAGTVNDDGVTGVAERVIADDVLEGPVESIDLSTGEFRVLAQTVVVTADTIFDDDFALRSLEGLASGDIVEIAGFLGDGRIVATRVDRDDSNDGFEVAGFVTSLDSGARTFKINDLVVDYTTAAIDDDFPGGAPAEGELVEAEGIRFENGTLFANNLDFWGNRPRVACDGFDDGDDDGDCDVEIQGYVSAVASASSFELNGVPVTINSGTSFEDGTAADIALNVRLEVDGFINAEGVVVATEIDFEDDERPIEIEARVQAVDLDNSVITLLGIRVQLNNRTRFEDFSSAQAFPFRAADIRVGDYLEVIGVPSEDASADVIATKVERDDDDDNTVSLQGFVEALAQPDLAILGVTVQTTVGTEFELGDNEASQAEFFAAIQVGELVDVDGIQVGDRTILADEVELGNEDIDD
ncbi:DUF5666 domain-containing protein [Thioalkalivibrio sp. XN279]|uniref:DUF5666 domain-containing protein n=1 Tax=Thioalkalivibrio sp. XN279 TaxID=2714953 RepID=UPI0014098921|nr:DUF5666 domain-containing protein [Thioalkalivibrio sp. XN279]NHA13633.1 hypothetical protein [Thioalkalivibrio sp. XN279]